VLRDNINNATKDAMKARDERRVATLRMMNAAIKNADIEARGQGKEPLNEADLMSLFQKMIKQRQESAELYDKGARPELAAPNAAKSRSSRPTCRKQMSTPKPARNFIAAAGDQRRDYEGHGPRHGGAEGALRRQDGFRQGSGKIKELLSKK
jgi:cell division protein FtsN